MPDAQWELSSIMQPRTQRPKGSKHDRNEPGPVNQTLGMKEEANGTDREPGNY